MKKLIGVLLMLIILGAFTSCNNNNMPEVDGPFKVIIYEEDAYGHPSHKVLFNTETKTYHEYLYYYIYDGSYRSIDHVDYIIYDQDGKKLN